MKDTLIFSVGAVYALLVGYSGYKAVSAASNEERIAAYKVLRLALAAGTGVSVVTLAVLHQAGVL
ncbi:hypothetical protein PV646_41170 [Streptomyces sp. ID05-26A]|nr:hypothetical protein [Streptomyces sp. ID05-26A]